MGCMPRQRVRKEVLAMSVENDFSVGSIPRHIIDLAIPMTLAQLVQMAYNLVDRIYMVICRGHLPLPSLGWV